MLNNNCLIFSIFINLLNCVIKFKKLKLLEFQIGQISIYFNFKNRNYLSQRYGIIQP